MRFPPVPVNAAAVARCCPDEMECAAMAVLVRERAADMEVEAEGRAEEAREPPRWEGAEMLVGVAERCACACPCICDSE